MNNTAKQIYYDDRELRSHITVVPEEIEEEDDELEFTFTPKVFKINMVVIAAVALAATLYLIFENLFWNLL